MIHSLKCCGKKVYNRSKDKDRLRPPARGHITAAHSSASPKPGRTLWDPLRHRGLNPSRAPGRSGSRWSGTDRFGTPGRWRRDWGVAILLPITNKVGPQGKVSGPTVEAGPAHTKPRPSTPGNCGSARAREGLTLTNQTAPPPAQRCHRFLPVLHFLI